MKLTASEVVSIENYLQDKPVIRAYVFGSYARGEADALSDLDLLVELDYSQPIGLQFIGMKYELEDQLHKSVDLVSANAVSPVFVLLSIRASNLFTKGRFGNKQRIEYGLDAIIKIETYISNSQRFYQ